MSDNINNNRTRDKSPYNLRPRRAINYSEVARGVTRDETEENDAPAARGRRRAPAAAGRGSRARGGGRRRTASGQANRASRSRSASASRSNQVDVDVDPIDLDDEEMDMDPDFDLQAAMGPDPQSTRFSLADKEFYPINFTEQEVSEALRNGRPCAAPGNALCSFACVGGLGATIDTVRKTIRLPLLCPEFYSEFKIRPKKGLIFYGPPGVGKTMTARALVEACKCYTNQRIAFFMRKGSDILNPYVGQSEANLSKLFDAARKLSPSIIFLDEFDALGRHRNNHSACHTESNVVSTLLALMDGLDDRGLVFVIAATNRLETIDPAFRRPGRFDVEICFKMPDLEARKDILSKATASWKIKSSVIDTVAGRTDGFNGADLASACEAAALKALERVNPELVDVNCGSDDIPKINTANIRVLLEDFEEALQTIQPSNKRLQGS